MRDWRTAQKRRTALLTAVAAATLAGLMLAAGAEQQTAPENPPAPTTQPVTTQPAPVETGDVVRANLASGLAGSKHDFRHLGQGVRDLCLPCHTPHLVAPPVPRLDQREARENLLRPYQSVGVTLDGWSLLCLGCHDGVTAQDVYTSAHAITLTGQLGNSTLGTKGLRSHPVGVRYPVNDEEYRAPAEVVAAGLPLPEGRVQCGTCHDAHNTRGYDGMLQISNARSGMCLTCHIR